MLPQNFKTAADLNIPEKERVALTYVLGVLERGEIAPQNFDMGCPWVVHECGSIGCIGGYVGTAMGVPSITDYVYRYQRSGALSQLYFPRLPSGKLHELAPITIDQAAAALRSFLTTGDACWNQTLAT